MSPSRKILLVDDDPSITNPLSERLTGAGYTVFVAHTGTEGLTAALKEHPELILLDIMMPEMNGWEMLEELQKDPWGKTAPVIILSNMDDMDNVSQAVAHQAHEYIIKGSWTMDDIVRKVEEKFAYQEAAPAGD
ncbi:MAG: response regulator [Patescibacteria group bacterium]